MNGKIGLNGGLTDYGDRDFALYLRRSFARSMGYSAAMLERPVVGIATSASGFNNCHRLMPELVDAVKRGALAAGALPLEFPTTSLGEVFLSPTSFVYRNLMAMDVEEMIRAQPMDAVVLIGGCDKTVPAQLMGAIAANKPAIQLVTGPMMTGRRAAGGVHGLPPVLGAVPRGEDRPRDDRRGRRGARGHRGHLRGPPSRRSTPTGCARGHVNGCGKTMSKRSIAAAVAAFLAEMNPSSRGGFAFPDHPDKVLASTT